MTDTVALKDAIRNSGMSLTYIADTLGITRGALYKKIDNITEFKASEIVTLKRILNLSDKERDDIFFDTKVEWYSTRGGERVSGYLVIIVVLLLNIYAVVACIREKKGAFAISKVLADCISLIYACTHQK